MISAGLYCLLLEEAEQVQSNDHNDGHAGEPEYEISHHGVISIYLDFGWDQRVLKRAGMSLSR